MQPVKQGMLLSADISKITGASQVTEITSRRAGAKGRKILTVVTLTVGPPRFIANLVLLFFDGFLELQIGILMQARI